MHKQNSLKYAYLVQSKSCLWTHVILVTMIINDCHLLTLIFISYELKIKYNSALNVDHNIFFYYEEVKTFTNINSNIYTFAK